MATYLELPGWSDVTQLDGAPEGSGGGPLESNVTALLVRSTEAGWSRGSVVAVDAGVHLSAITRILEETQPLGLGSSVPLPHVLESGPFAGLEIKSASASANAAHITRHILDTYVITHPHLDHISGFVINTAGLPGTRQKRLAGLPSTISAFKSHIFNNVIWPNLSDENNGAGLVTYLRLMEGGSPALGEGDGKGYMEVSDGLTVRVFGVSHGHCIEKHVHRGSGASSRFGSGDASSMLPQRGMPGSHAALGTLSAFRSSSTAQGSPGLDRDSVCVYDSSAYFIREPDTGREVLIFGDVEPDGISLSPRNLTIWQEAAPRVANGNLAAIFIECSYDDSQTVDRLFGHLTPRFVVEEMKVLAAEVEAVRRASQKREPSKKRKREVEEDNRRANRKIARSGGDDTPISPKTSRPSSLMGSVSASGVSDYGFEAQHIATPTADMLLKDLDQTTTPTLVEPQTRNALKGLKIVIIHVKEKLDGSPPAGERILQELLEHEEDAQLGCEFVISNSGQSFEF
ncbi:hypothetical protein DL769_009777 [Monosporascus sp. CRB-8-3]|nr:hypothetical protein DL769_009777 [Monosporascus sp. CRB-8-3]